MSGVSLMSVYVPNTKESEWGSTCIHVLESWKPKPIILQVLLIWSMASNLALSRKLMFACIAPPYKQDRNGEIIRNLFGFCKIVLIYLMMCFESGIIK